MSTSEKSIANRKNSRASTGPRTSQGRARSARNSHRHGLAIPILLDCTLAADARDLANEITGAGASAELLSLAQRIAAAQIDLVRIRRSRHDLMVKILENLGPVPAARAADIDIWHKLAKGRLLQRLKELESRSPFTSDVMQSIAAIDRYERRALSRRAAAIHAFDAAKCAHAAITDPGRRDSTH